MSCHHDDKFDSQKLILLRTFNWCATSHDGYSSKTRRSDGRIPRGMLFYAHYLARDGHVCGTGRQLGMIPILSTNGGQRIPSTITEGWEGVRFGEAQDVSTKHSFVSPTVQALSRGSLSALRVCWEHFHGATGFFFGFCLFWTSGDEVLLSPRAGG
jgi:hypothetical protein